MQRDLSLYLNWLTLLQLGPNLHLRSGCMGDRYNHRRGWSPFERAATTLTTGGDCRLGTEASVVVLRELAGRLSNWI